MLKQAKNIFNETYLIVGVISDKIGEDYKRAPIINKNDRYDIIKSIGIVDEIIKDPPLIIPLEFIEKHNINKAVHRFFNKEDYNKQKKF